MLDPFFCPYYTTRHDTKCSKVHHFGKPLLCAVLTEIVLRHR